MKIVRSETFVVGNPPPHLGGVNWVFVKLTTDEGIHGWGEAYGSEVYFASAARLLDEMCEHFVIGADPFAIERLWKTLYASGYTQHADIHKLSAISAIEIACWDIVGKAAGQPIYNLLGGRYHDQIRTYSYLTRRSTTHCPPMAPCPTTRIAAGARPWRRSSRGTPGARLARCAAGRPMG